MNKSGLITITLLIGISFSTSLIMLFDLYNQTELKTIELYRQQNKYSDENQKHYHCQKSIDNCQLNYVEIRTTGKELEEFIQRFSGYEISNLNAMKQKFMMLELDEMMVEGDKELIDLIKYTLIYSENIVSITTNNQYIIRWHIKK